MPFEVGSHPVESPIVGRFDVFDFGDRFFVPLIWCIPMGAVEEEFHCVSRNTLAFSDLVAHVNRRATFGPDQFFDV